MQYLMVQVTTLPRLRPMPSTTEGSQVGARERTPPIAWPTPESRERKRSSWAESRCEELAEGRLDDVASQGAWKLRTGMRGGESPWRDPTRSNEIIALGAIQPQAV